MKRKKIFQNPKSVYYLFIGTASIWAQKWFGYVGTSRSIGVAYWTACNSSWFNSRSYDMLGRDAITIHPK